MFATIISGVKKFVIFNENTRVKLKWGRVMRMITLVALKSTAVDIVFLLAPV